jgi:3-oxoacyl-[acyl-carrier-protein] synthase-3
VQRELGLPDGRVFAFDVNATCLSFLVALEVAARMVAAGAARHALIVSSEITRDSLNPEEPESYVLMGDAAAAAILSAAGPGEASALCHSAFTTYASGADLTRVAGGGTLHHPNDPATTAAMNYFTMEGPAVYRMAARLLPPFLERFLAEAGWERTTIDAVVPHQASSRGLELLTRRCSFRPEQLVINLAERGNCVAASIPLALAEAVHAGRIRRGHRLLLVGTGAGLSLGAATLVF